MKFISIIAIIASASAVRLAEPARVVNGGPLAAGDCLAPLDVSQKELDNQLDYFSRSFSKTHYNNAINIYNALLEQGTQARL